MKNIFEEISNVSGPWYSALIGEINTNPVFVRVMQAVEAPFHVHKNSDEMFIVLEGELYIDFPNDTICLRKGDSHTVVAGTEHRARVPDYAQLIVIGGKD
ncbi:MAG: cupin domain-containing protein [Gammaproteobacteria bacterium]|nr:cupin domain-containing protein [Gammaproteobacteria bacterium]MDH5652585.1 cupin domain-containing protein [Gammaproteobacteria bacterium]